MDNTKPVRVRFAPSPTGPLHMGGVRTALYNYLFAKKHGGDFILRIEDTDQTRFVPGAEQYIVEALKWCGIQPNEGIGFGDGNYKPYRQSERKSMYRQYAEQLVKNGHAYYAFDTTEELEEARTRIEKAGGSFSYNAISRQNLKNSISLSEDEVKKKLDAHEHYVIRIKIPRNEEVRLQDIIRGWVVVNSSQMDDKVLFKSDGMPTYHLANVVDDYLMKITHVIRGEEWLPSAPLHVLLYRYLGWEDAMPQFAHLPLLLRPDGNGKLSKRDGDRLGFPVFPLNWIDPVTKEQSSGYREKGYFPDAFINMLALLGWHASGNKELFSLDELVQEFSLERVSKHGAKFDPEKTKWFNQQYLRNKSDEELA
ncbi:MAG TPA: glutamate--tRNA ligase, partial [Bacteroidia bacterium]|nr:glutamate--tRNA ligase [Bacteroidia bacterium]